MAFVAIIALINGSLVALAAGLGFGHASLESILGYLFAPLAWVMGVVHWSDEPAAGV
ncbi:nucleoside transporter C-terminal domain-containing protein [Shigella flexneri]